ncbi:unnamed protein product [Cylindrotheca closterium]|uniref:Reverse transcriptase Ty1/copia-type domain-containing protein n=1 Tax=Cylindrotheca closterium TaxID=2856 RepID=A0AAD2G1M6_9STRA|nr:unnamed protein product [Cylindrotheca closterium]
MKADYEVHNAIMIARCMMQIKAKFDTDEGLNFIQQYYINQGLKTFGDDGKDAVDKELRQMPLRDCFTPEFVKDMTASERKKAQSAMMLLAEKQLEKTIKGRLVFRGDGTREWLSREDTASPTALQEAITTTCVIDTHEGRDIMTMDVPNAFIQTYMPEAKEGEDRIYMKITAMMVQILIDMAPEYRKYVVLENGKRVIYVRQTIRFHVEDLMSSHMDPKVNDKFSKWLNMRYGSIKACTIIRGKIHRYLEMTLDLSVKGNLKIRMDDYVKNMLEDFPIKFNKDSKQETPAGNDLLEAGKGSYSIVVSPDTSAESLRVMKWMIDGSFAVHPDFKSHTGGTLTFGGGAAQVMSKKQKLNSRSSTEAELIAVDNVVTMLLWTKLFMKWQGYPIKKNILYQDNKSAILLEENGRKSAGKRSRAINIHYFFITDQVEKGNVKIEYCPTDNMIADFMTKPLQGEKFRKFRDPQD